VGISHVQLKRGRNYLIIPCTSEPKEAHFTLSVFLDDGNKETSPEKLFDFYELTEQWKYVVSKKVANRAFSSWIPNRFHLVSNRDFGRENMQAALRIIPRFSRIRNSYLNFRERSEQNLSSIWWSSNRKIRIQLVFLRYVWTVSEASSRTYVLPSYQLHLILSLHFKSSLEWKINQLSHRRCLL